MPSDHVHWIVKSCSTSCYTDYFFKNMNLTNLPSLSTSLSLALPTGTFLNTASYAADGLSHFCKHQVYLEHSLGSPPASKTPPLITWTWENKALIYLFLCTSCTYSQFPAGRGGEEERKEMPKYSLGYKTHVAACLPHTSCTERNWVCLGKKNLGETKLPYTYQAINPGKEFFAVPGTHVNKCSCTVKPYPHQEGKSLENQNM